MDRQNEEQEVVNRLKGINLSYRPRQAFKAFHARDKRFSLIVAHRRAGKTVMTVNDLIARALNTSKKNAFYGYVGPFLAQTKQLAWGYLKEYTSGIPNVKISESDYSVKFANSGGSISTIRLFGADNPDALRGLYFDGIVLDEFGDMKGRVWSEVIRPALADRQGWAVFIGTPKGKNKFYELRERARKELDRWFLLELKASESKILPQAEMEEMRHELDDDEWMQEMECSFEAAIKGSYYGRWITRLEEKGQITKVDVIPSIPLQTAWDLGKTDATAVWFFQIYSGQLRIVDYYEASNLELDEILWEIEDKGYALNRLGTLWLPHDAKAKRLGMGKSVIEQLLAHDFDCQLVPIQKVRDGIEAVRKTLPQCWFDEERCYTGLDRLKSYQRKWDADRQVFSNTPDHDIASHGADAFRYLAESVSDKQISRSIPEKSTEIAPIQAQIQYLADMKVNIVEPVTYCLNDLWDLADNFDSSSRI